jgi:hypothetical protein
LRKCRKIIGRQDRWDIAARGARHRLIEYWSILRPSPQILEKGLPEYMVERGLAT